MKIEKNVYKRQFISNNLWVFFGHLLVYLRGIILLPILIKTVGISIYGAYALITSYIGILYGISTFGIRFRYTRFMPSASDDIREKQDLFYFQFFIHLFFLVIISIILIFTNDFIKITFFSKDISYSVIWPVGILFATFIFAQTTDYYRYTHRLKFTSIAGGFAPYLYILFIVLGLYFMPEINLNFLMGARSFSYVIISIPLALLILKEIKFKFPQISIKKIYNDIKLGIPLIFVFIIDFILSGSDRFVLAYYMTSKAVGYYNPGYTLGSLVIMFPKMLGVSLPQILALSTDKGDESTPKILIEKSIKIFLLLCIPFIIGGAILSKPLLVLFANKEVADSGYLVTPIVSFGILFYGLNYILANTVVYLKMKNELIMYSNIIAAILNIILNIIFISIFRNVVIAAITTFISYFLAFLFLNYKIKNLMIINYHWDNILRIIVSSLAMGGFLILSESLFYSKVLMLTILLPLSIAIYMVLVFLLKVVTNEEINYFLNFFKNKFAKNTV